MANYNCTIRTNYFHVKDEEKFDELMNRVAAEDLKVFHENEMVGFGSYGSILGIAVEEDGEEDYDAFVDELQKLVVDDEAILIMEAGYEKLRYVTGSVLVITSKGTEYRSIENIGIELAQKMLNNPGYHPQTSY